MNKLLQFSTLTDEPKLSHNQKMPKRYDLSAWASSSADKDIDHNRLKIQLLMLPDMIKTDFAGEVSVKKVTNVRTIANAMGKSDIY